MVERILLASDGPGAWTARAAVADLVASSRTPIEVEVLHARSLADLRGRGVAVADKVHPGASGAEL